ncbi:hypothetical protein ABEB36_000308 [Hypothenemus hampei]|uniref:Uncharacterized protein n=1 Tax=Hypothenemus hampei TaxID=57062 RepID=A0ABD1FAS9_HYPHA
MTAMTTGLLTVCAIVNETLYCTIPSEVEYENPNGNLTLPTILGKLQVVLKNGTIIELPIDWNKLPIPSVFSNFHIICSLLAIIIVLIAFTHKQYPSLRDYIKRKIDICMNSQWDNVFTSPSRNPSTSTTDAIYNNNNNNKGKRKRIVPDGVYTIDSIMQIIYKSSAQTKQVTLQCPNKRPIKFTYEEFMKFLDFVYGFMTDIKENEKEKEEEKIKWCDFVIGQYVFLSCYWNATDEDACGLAVQDTHNSDYVTLNKNEMLLLTSEKYNLYEFLNTTNKKVFK